MKEYSVAKWQYLLYVWIEYSAVCKHMHSLIYLYVFPAFSIRQICMLLAEEFAVTPYMMSDWVHMQLTLLSCVPISVNVNMYICVYVNVGSHCVGILPRHVLTCSLTCGISPAL